MKKRSLQEWYQAITGMEKILVASCVFSMGLTCLRIVYSGTPTFIFLVWNLFLALVPYLITKYMMQQVRWIDENRRFLSGFTVWLLFIPNSFYIITDLFHLEERGYVPLWFDLALIFSFAWNGMILGILSMRQMECMLQLKWKLSSEWLFVLPVMCLNALGIYIGRYLRYNTWDVVADPGGLMEDIIFLILHPLRNRFDWSMIGCFAAVLTIVYVSIKRMREDS